MDLFEYMRDKEKEETSPLAGRMRPVTLDDVVGQKHILGKDKLLYRAIMADRLSSLILYGPPGCGKTTLVSLIPRLYDTDEGEILVDGINVKDYTLYNLREGVGMVLQKNVLFSGTIEESPLCAVK